MVTFDQLLMKKRGRIRSIAEARPDWWMDPQPRFLGATGGRRFTAADKCGLQLTSPPDPTTQDFWISCWIKVSSYVSVDTVLFTGASGDGVDGFWLCLQTANRFRFFLNDSVQGSRLGMTSTATWTANKWHHVVITVDRDDVATLYLDGVANPADTLDVSGHQGSLGSTGNSTLGVYNTSGLFGFNGDMSRLFYGEGTLPTAAEIAELHNNGNGKFYAELSSGLQAKVTHAWNLNEGSNASVAYDAKGSNDGTVTAAELITDGGFEAITEGSDLVTNGGFETFTHGYRTFVATDKVRAYATALEPGTQDFFLSVVVRPNNTAAIKTVIATGAGGDGADRPGFWLYVDTDEELMLAFNDEDKVTRVVTNIADDPIPTGSDSHILIVFDRDDVATCYINGVVQSKTLTISGRQGSLGADLNITNIGAYTLTQYNFDGTMSRLFYGAGTLPDATAIADLAAGGNYSQLLSATQALIDNAWNLNESDPTSNLTDSKGSNHGVLQFGELVTNGTFASDVSGWTNNVTWPWETVAWDAGEMNVAETGTPTITTVSQELTLTPGNEYTLSLDTTKNSGGNLQVGITSGHVTNLPTGPIVLITGSGAASNTADASGSAWNLCIGLPGGQSPADWNVDNVSVKVTGIKATADDFGNWLETRTSNNCAVFVSGTPTPVPEGSVCVGLNSGDRTGTARIYAYDMAVEPGQRYRLKVNSYGDGTNGLKLYIRDETTPAWILQDQELNTTAAWVEETIEFEAPAGCVAAKPYIYANDDADNTVCYVDNVSMHKLTFSNWTEVESSSSQVVVNASEQDAGNYCCELEVDGSNNNTYVTQSGVLTVGNEYFVSLRGKASANSKTLNLGGGFDNSQFSFTTSWDEYSDTIVADDTPATFQRASAAGESLYLDTISVTSTGPSPCAGPREATASDSSGNGYHGILTGFSNTLDPWSSDIPSVFDSGYSLEGDGTGYVPCGDVTVLNSASAFTIEGWVQLDDVTAANRIWDKGYNGINLETSSSKMYAVVDSGDYGYFTLTGVINNGQWHHVAIVFDGSGATPADKLKVYVDGASQTLAFAGTIPATTADQSAYEFTFGHDTTNSIDGRLHKWRIYSSALSAADITTLAVGSDTSTSPAAHWTFDDGPQGGEPSDGDPVPHYESREGHRYQFNQATASARPVYRAAGINNRAAIELTGDEFLKCVQAIFDGEEGSLACVIQTSDNTQLDQTVLSQADESSTDDHLSLKIRDDNTNVGMTIESNVGGSLTTAYSDDTPADDTTYIYEISSDGSTYTERINGVVKTISGTDNGNWFGDPSNLDNTVIGALVNSGGDSEHGYLLLGQMVGWNTKQRSNVMANVRRLLAAQYGVAL